MDAAVGFEELLSRGVVRVADSSVFHAGPGPTPVGFDWGRIEGMMLGLAIGDALGNTSEGMLPAQRGARYGEVRDYLPNRYADGWRVGLPSGDSQLAF